MSAISLEVVLSLEKILSVSCGSI